MTLTTLTENYFGIVVPDDAYEVHTFNDGEGLCYWHVTNYEYIHLPARYCLICVSGTASEEQAREIVEWYGKGDGSIDEAGVGDTFWCYDDSKFCLNTALASLQSLLTSKGLSGTVAILEVLHDKC